MRPAPLYLCTAALCACLLASPAAMAAMTAAGPETSIARLQQAIDTRDVALLEKYMDIDSVVSKAVAAAITDPAAMQAASRTPALALALAGLQGSPETRAAVSQLLTGETSSFIRAGISTGAFAGHKVPKDQRRSAGLLSPLLAGASKARKTFGPSKVMEHSTNQALVSTSIYDDGSEERYPLTLRLTRNSDSWRVVEVVNLHELSARIR